MTAETETLNDDYPPLSEAEVHAVKSNHRRVSDGYPWCEFDGMSWPCPTIRLIAERERSHRALEPMRWAVEKFDLRWYDAIDYMEADDWAVLMAELKTWPALAETGETNA